MKLHLLFFIFICLLSLSCESDDNNRDDNPCLVNKKVNVVYNLNFPLYAAILDAGLDGKIFIDDRAFIKGVYVRIIGNQATALELAEPNDCVGECSIPELEDGFFIYECGNTITKYDFGGNKVDGAESDSNMREYNTSLSNNTLTISY